MPQLSPTPETNAGIQPMLREFQGYVLAYRLRAAVGGRVTPRGKQLELAAYARKRRRRQALALGLVQSGIDPSDMRELDALSNELMFGFWHNPLEVGRFVSAVLRWHPHPALGDVATFAALFTPTEKSRLGYSGVVQACQYHHHCLLLASPLLDPDATDRLWDEINRLEPPLFVDEVCAGYSSSGT